MNYPTTFEEAEAFEAHAAGLVEKNKAASGEPRSAQTRATIEAIQALVPAGTYRHFKGGAYTVSDVVEDVNTGECYVRYAAQYGAYEGVAAIRVLVGEDSFLRPIDRESYKGVRFTRED